MERRKFSSREELKDAIENRKSEDGPANTWDVSAITDMSFLFKMTEFNEAIDQWDTSNVTTMEGMFMSSSFNQDISTWDVSNVTNMKKMFKAHMISTVFNQPLPWDVSRVENMEGMFMNSIFNQPLKWNTSSVTNMQEMFCNSQMNQPLSLDVSKVENMESMFMNSKFDQDISEWTTSSVTNMKNMFYRSLFNHPLPWNVSKVVNMERMFMSSLFNQDISKWDVGNVTNMSHMFEYSKFDQDIRAWNVARVTETTNIFSESPMMGERNKPPEFIYSIKEIKKKITIFIFLHGDNLKDELPRDLPLHTSIAVRPGTCTFFLYKSTTDTLEKIETMEKHYHDKPIFEGNAIYREMFQPFQDYYFEENEKDVMTAVPGFPREELLALHQERTSPLRRLMHNRKYTISDDKLAPMMGIFIINAQENGREIEFTYPESIDIKDRPFREDRSMYIKDDYMNLQRRNLLNVEVANSLFPGGFKLESNDDYTNIDHVPSITLLDIIRFFEKMGFDYVNIIDEGCRGESIDKKTRRQKSIEERKNHDFFLENFPIAGGTRKKHKRKTRHVRKLHSTKRYKRHTRNKIS
jgi:surface protein